MALKQMLLEMGMGVDLHGGDYTKAARRAVEDAIGHNSLNFVRQLVGDPNQMHVHIIVGVPQPAKVDREKVLAVLPFGKKSLEAVPGGLQLPCGRDAPAEARGDITVIANAAVMVSLDLP